MDVGMMTKTLLFTSSTCLTTPRPTHRRGGAATGAAALAPPETDEDEVGAGGGSALSTPTKDPFSTAGRRPSGMSDEPRQVMTA